EDIATVREALAIPLPADPSDSDQLLDYLMTITQGPVVDDSTVPATRSPGVFLGVFLGASHSSPLMMTEWPAEMGVSIAEFDADLIAGLPPETLTIWIGSIDPARVAAAVIADPMWSDDLRPLSHAGYDHWCWGDDPSAIDVERRTAMRPLGRGGCLAAFEGTAYRTVTAEAMDAALEVRAGDGTSLADVEALRLAAAALDDAGAHTAAFTMAAERFEFDAVQLDQPLLDRWTALGAGAGFDQTGDYLVIALVYDDDATASANAATLATIASSGRSVSVEPGRPWSDIYQSLGPVTSDGPVVIARFYGSAITRRWPIVAGLPDALTMWGA
ncbi:MAG: hypothetical protein KJ698_05030, partial [Actinobacteria bacterium]|nr:hypothetical protein [Actinomycetota bacterium]